MRIGCRTGWTASCGKRAAEPQPQAGRVLLTVRFVRFFTLIFVEERSMRLRNVWISGLGIALVASVACGGGANKSAEPTAPAGTPAGQKVDMATAGDVKGSVTLDGTAPKNAPIKMNADPVCMKANKDPQFQETFEVADGKVANAFVYVKDGLGNYVFDLPTESLSIDQKDCRYHPHVFGARVGQKLVIKNSDD